MLTDINTLHNPQPSYNTCKHTAKTRTRDFSEIQRKKRNQLCTLQSGNKLRQSVVNHAAKTHRKSILIHSQKTYFQGTSPTSMRSLSQSSYVSTYSELCKKLSFRLQEEETPPDSKPPVEPLCMLPGCPVCIMQNNNHPERHKC
jgi:hypothetical protein